MVKILYILSLSMIYLDLSGQNSSVKKFTDNIDYGVKFGLSASHFASKQNNLDIRASFLAGLTAEHPIYKKFNLKMDLLYLRQGKSDRFYSPENGQNENTYKLDYIQIPLLLSYPIVENLRIESGLGMSFLLRSKQELITNNIEVISQNNNDFNNFDLNFNIGVYYPTTWNFGVGLRYSRGLIDINKNDNHFTTSTFNSILQLALEYRF